LNFYGGKNDLEMKAYSNIFFSNGMLDPWSGGSPTSYLGEDLPVNYMN
jgi:lysosomal Pro-X carboxypeptidase